MRQLVYLLTFVAWAAARMTQAAPVDVGTYWIRIDDSAGFPAFFTGEATFAGNLAGVNPITTSGYIQNFSFGPPGGGYGDFTSTQQSDNPADLSWSVNNGTFVCPTAGCNSGSDISFVGTVTGVGGTMAGMLPANSTFTGDGVAHLVASIPGVPLCDPPPPNHRCFVGTTAFNAFQDVPTPASSPEGAIVTVGGNTTYYNSLLGLTIPITTDVTFLGGVAPGGATTTFSTVSNAAGQIGSNFAGAVGSFRAQYTDIVVDPPGAYTGPVVVCSTFAGSGGVLQGTNISVCDLHILHQEGTDFEDVTLGLAASNCPLNPSTPCPGAARCIDPAANRVCGQADHLSFFTVVPFVGDSDGDGVADPSDPCTRATALQLVAKARVVTKHIDLPSGQQMIVWKGSFDPDDFPGSILDVANRGVHVRVDGCLVPPGTGIGTPIDLDIPGGLVGSGCHIRDGWSQRHNDPGFGSWTYSNRSGFLDGACSVPAGGTTKVVVKDRRLLGQGVKFAVTAKNVVAAPTTAFAPGCQLYGAIALAPRLPGGGASPQALAGECGEFSWLLPAATAKPAPFCRSRPVGTPVTETCVGP